MGASASATLPGQQDLPSLKLRAADHCDVLCLLQRKMGRVMK